MPYEIKKVFASLPQVERGVSKIVGGDPKGNSFLYTNGKCVILRNIDAQSPEETRKGGGDQIGNVQQNI